MQTLLDDLDSSSELNTAKTLVVDHNGIEYTIHFESPRLKAIFEVFYSEFGNTIPYYDIHKRAGYFPSMSRLSTDAANINSSISHINLKIVNHKGQGYRLVEGTENSQIKDHRFRTFQTKDNQELTLECNGKAFELLQYIASSNGVSTKDMQSYFSLPTELRAQQFMQELAKRLRSIGWNLKGHKAEDGIRRYTLVNLETEN